jgi:hypothetical protein
LPGQGVVPFPLDRSQGHKVGDVGQDLVGAAEHALHAFEIHALPCHRRSLLALLIDLEVASRLSGSLRNDLFLVGARLL